MKKLFPFFAVVAITLTLTISCNNMDDLLQIGKTSITNANTVANDNVPYTDTTTLKTISKTKGYVDYKVAHKLVLIQMNMSINKQMNWNGTKLSQLPVVVYDAKSNPKYYEFIVKKQDGTPIGTVTAAAKKEVGASVAYTLPYVRDYNYVSSKGAVFKMISAGYPNHILVGVISKGGDTPSGTIDPSTGQSVNADTILTEDAQGAITAVKNMSQVTLDSLHTDAGTLISGIQQKDQQNQQQANDYWAMVDTLNANIANMSDDSINSIINTGKGFESYTVSDIHILSPYINNPGLLSTYWQGWCGPSAIAMIYRAYYSSYNNINLPLEGDASFVTPGCNGIYSSGRFRSSLYPNTGGYFFMDTQNLDKNWVRNQSNKIDNGLYADIAEWSNMYGNKGLLGVLGGPGSTTFWDLSNALFKVTKGKMFVNPIPIITFLPVELNAVNAGHAWLRMINLPLLCVVDGATHYQIAIGSQIDLWKWDFVFKFFGTHRTNLLTIPTGRWLYLMDDGYHMQDNGNKAYWKNDSWNFDYQFGIVKL